MTIECDICGKESEKCHSIWYTLKMPEIFLCLGHLRKWNKEHKDFVEKHKDIKPTTNEWYEMCEKESTLFMKWFKEQVENDKTK